MGKEKNGGKMGEREKERERLIFVSDNKENSLSITGGKWESSARRAFFLLLLVTFHGITSASKG